MFKKTLLALAIAGFATSSMAAVKSSLNAGGSIAGTPATQAISFEGAQSSSNFPLGDITLDLGSANIASYTSSVSGVQVTITGGTLSAASNFDVEYVDAAVANAVASAKASGTVTYPSSTIARLTFAGADQTKVKAGAATGDGIIIKGLVITPTSLALGSEVTVKVETLSAVPGSPIDDVSVVATKVINQFTLANITGDALAGTEGGKSLKVDVSDARNSWTDGTKVTVDKIKATLSSAKIDILKASAIGKQITYVVTGTTGFSFLDADASGAVDTGTVTTTTTTPVFNTGMTTLTETAAAIGPGLFDGVVADTGITESFDFDVAPATTKYVIAPQSFSLTATLPYADATAKAQSVTLSDTAGSWSLNGSSVTIPYMPFGTNTQVILRATNTSSVAGDLTVRYMAEGSQASWKDLGVIGTVPAGVTNVSDLVINAIKTDMGNPTTGQKVALELTTNSPSSAITFFAGFKVLNGENDRGIVGTFGAKGSAVQGN